MAQETLTVQAVTRAGITPSYQSVTTLNGFRFKNDGHTILFFEEQNGAGAVTLGFQAERLVDGAQPAAKSVTIPSSGKKTAGPWPPEIYNDADGYMNFTINADQANGVVCLSVR